MSSINLELSKLPYYNKYISDLSEDLLMKQIIVVLLIILNYQFQCNIIYNNLQIINQDFLIVI